MIYRDSYGVFPCDLQQLWKLEKCFSWILCDLLLAGLVYSLDRHIGCLPGLLVAFCLLRHREPWLSLLRSKLEEADAFFLLSSMRSYNLRAMSKFNLLIKVYSGQGVHNSVAFPLMLCVLLFIALWVLRTYSGNIQSCFSVVTINILIMTRRMLAHIIFIMFLAGFWLHHRSTECKTKKVLGLGVSWEVCLTGQLLDWG